MCARCAERGALTDDDALARLEPIVAFHRDLFAAAIDPEFANELPDPAVTIERGRSLGIRPLDLMLGVLQPVLYELGRQWQAGTLTPAFEARFTAFTEQVLDLFHLEQLQHPVKGNGRPIFLVAAPTNGHTLGLRMLGFAMREAGHDVRLGTGPIGVEALLDLVVLVRPSFVGVSVSLPTQLQYVRDLVAAIDARDLDTRVVVGGLGIATVDRSTLPARLLVMTDNADVDWLGDLGASVEASP